MVSTARPRIQHDDYFAAGLDLLAEGGVSRVTIAGLCERLGVTSGSFYHHFKSVPDFSEQLLAHWEATGNESTRQVWSVLDAYERLSVLKHLAVAIPHEAEAAIRAWGRSDERVATVVQRVDAAREANLVKAFLAVGIGKARSRTLARIGMSIMIAAQAMERPVDRKRLLDALDEYQRWLVP